MKIFLTGATGFLGGRIAEALRGEEYAVRALVRPGSDTTRLTELKVELAEGDLLDQACLGDAMAECDGVIHTAALVTSWEADRELFRRVNVEATRNLLALAQRNHVKLMVYTSSFMALGPTNGQVVAEQHTALDRHYHNDYEKSKAEALEIAREFQGRGLPLIILLPGMIYGPGKLTAGNYVVRMIIDYLHGKVPGLPGGGKSVWSYSYIDDVVAGHLQAVRRGRSGEEYILGGDNRSLADLFAVLSDISGRPALKRAIPLGLLKGYARLQDLAASLLKRRPVLTAAEIEIFKHDWAYNSEKAVRRLGYSPVPLETGLKLTLEWLEAEGLA
jgi:farnesol dehydrogenase